MPRKVTNKLIGWAEEGYVTWESVALMAMSYMSENDVADMARCNDLLEICEDE
jgi:hypothetical protein